MDDLAVITDQYHTCVYANPAFCEVYSGTPEHWRQKPFPAAKDLPLDESTHGTASKPIVFESKIKTTRTDVWIEWRKTIGPNGEYLFLGRNITDRKASFDNLAQKVSEAEAGSNSKMRFLATMSHEMRTPLNGILGMAGLLLDTDLNKSQKTYTDAVRESGTALLALINDILDYSKMDANQLSFEDTTFDPQSLIQGVTELLSPRAAHKGIEIASYIAPNVPCRLIADEGRLRQVLLNLAGNGVKFTDTGGVTIEVTAVTPTKDNITKIRMDVRDTGIGIPAHEVSEIFDEFVQADSSSTRKCEGTGLGLTIARRIIRAMGGDIIVQSKFGKGSLFSFIIPIKTKIDAPRLATLRPISDTVIVLTQSTVLKRIIPLQLKSAGVADFHLASSTPEALKLLGQNQDRTLLCDLSFAAQHSQKLIKAAGHSLVLLSPVTRGRLGTFRRAGFGGYLIKPIRQSSLHERLIEKAQQTSTTTSRLDAPATAPRRDTPKYRVLLAEDNQINTILASTIIKRAGHQVDIAGNGKEAVAALQHAHYDVVLMDMHMPVMDGIEASRRIRALGDELAAIPIIALTANVQSQDRKSCAEAGMNDFLTKPFSPEDLVSLIEKWAAHALHSDQQPPSPSRKDTHATQAERLQLRPTTTTPH